MNPGTKAKLAPEQIRQFKRDGFFPITRLVDDQTLEALRAEYDRLISGEIECGEDNRLLGGRIHQVINPSRYSPFIRDNPAVRKAKEIAAQLVGAPDSSQIKEVFDMLIDKPAGTEEETPWHQDYAYTAMPMAAAGTVIPKIASIQFWVALDDVDLDNGCMQFAPGLHTGPMLAHTVFSGDPTYEGRLLSIDKIDSSRAVACPLPAGGCTVHHFGTPHYTGPNKTESRGRRAYIFNLNWVRPPTTFQKIRKRPSNSLYYIYSGFLAACGKQK